MIPEITNIVNKFNVSSSKQSYHSSIYRNFLEIEPDDFQKIVSFFQDNEEEIKKIEFPEYFELLVTYVNALFEIGDYRKHLDFVDVVIENSILRNIQYFKGEDIYRKMLFKKAASFFNVREFNKADYVLRELIKIDPFEKDSIQFLKKCLGKSRTSTIRFTTGLSIFLILTTFLIFAVEILYIKPFYTSYSTLFKYLRIGSFLLSGVTMGFGRLVHFWKIEKEVYEFAESIKNQKLKQ